MKPSPLQVVCIRRLLLAKAPHFTLSPHLRRPFGFGLHLRITREGHSPCLQFLPRSRAVSKAGTGLAVEPLQP